MITKNCLTCEKEFRISNKREGTAKNCSRDCDAIWKSKNIKTFLGKHHTLEAKEKMRKAKLLNPPMYWLGREVPEERIQKRKNTMLARYGKLTVNVKWTEEGKRKLSENRKGEGNPMYGKHSWNYGLKGYKNINAQGKRRSLEAKQKMKESRLNFVKNNPELNRVNCLKGALNARNKLAKIITKPESFIENILDKCGLQEGLFYKYDCVLKTKNGPKFPDFRLLYKKEIIEADGTYWHKNKIKETIRDTEIKEQGYKINHISEDLILNNPQEAIKQIVGII